jgi:hypothetical protein
MALRRVVAACVALALWAAGTAARAEAPSAEALFREGRDAAHRGDYATACARFNESYKLVATAGTLLNLGDCEQHLGHYVTALARFRRALGELPAGDERIDIARSAIADLVTRVPHVTVMLAPGPTPATHVTLDGAPLERSQLGTSVEVDPGRHVVMAGRDGHLERKYVLELAESQSRGVVVEPGASLEPAAPAPPPPAAPPPRAATDEGAPGHRSSTKRTLGFVIGGVGIAGIAAGSVFGIMALGDKSTRDAHCPGPGNTCDPTGVDAVHAGSRDATVSTVAFIVGGAALATGAYLVLTSRPSHSAAVGVVSTRGGAVLGLDARF